MTMLSANIKGCKNYHGDDSQDFVIFLQVRTSAGELFECRRHEFSRSTCKKATCKKIEILTCPSDSFYSPSFLYMSIFSD